MKIRDDMSYVTDDSDMFITRGFAARDLHSVRLSFVYTDTQATENKTRFYEFEKLSAEEKNAYYREGAMARSAYMKPVMEAIGERFKCYQWKPEKRWDFRGQDWELFFWCGYFHGSLTGRDFSYIKLNFNQNQTRTRRIEIKNRLLVFLKTRFKNLENLDVAVQWKVDFDDKKVDAEARRVGPLLDGKKYNDGWYDGRLTFREFDGEITLSFWKKYARRPTSILDECDILRAAWRLGIA